MYLKKWVPDWLGNLGSIYSSNSGGNKVIIILSSAFKSKNSWFGYGVMTIYN